MVMTEERLQEIKEEIAYAEDRPLEFPLVHIAKELVIAFEEETEVKDQTILQLKKQLEMIGKQAWKQVELLDGNYVTFVGVHALAWKKGWGQPTVAFNRWDDMPRLDKNIQAIEEQMRDEANTKVEKHIQELERLSPGGPDGSGA